MPRRTLLVVEDDKELREYYRTVLSLEGYDVVESANGLDALRCIDSAPPDLIVLDLGLPEITGYEILTEVSMQAFTRRIPIVVVTGTVERLDHLPVECVLRKPITSDALIQAVRRCLGSS